MKKHTLMIRLVIGASFLVGASLRSVDAETAGSLTDVRRESLRLIGEDFKKLPPPLAERDAVAEVPADVILLEPLVTTDERAPDLTPRRETSFEKFVRTGTLVRYEGKRTTTRLWMKGDRGLMLEFSR
jgi:hypothetical protein